MTGFRAISVESLPRSDSAGAYLPVKTGQQLVVDLLARNMRIQQLSMRGRGTRDVTELRYLMGVNVMASSVLPYEPIEMDQPRRSILVVKRAASQNGKPGGWIVYDESCCIRRSRPFPTREEAEMVRQGLLAQLDAR
jgi:hypothetical protein